MLDGCLLLLLLLLLASWLFYKASASVNCDVYAQELGTSLFLCFIFQEGFVALEEVAALSGMKSTCGIPYL